MPEHLKALVVVIGIAVPVLALARQPVSFSAYNEQVYKNHRATWLAVALIVFLSHSFWISIALCAAVMTIRARQEETPLALYFFVLFAAPHFNQLIPGIGPIEHFFEASYVRILVLTAFVPFAIRLFNNKDTPRPISRAADFALISYLGVMLVTQALNDSFIGTLRALFYLLVDAWVPYYVASRALTNLKQFREIAAALVVSTLIVALLAVFESTRHWLLYESLRNALGVPQLFTAYLYRSDGGLLRPYVSVGHAIVVGYVIMVGLGMFSFLSPHLRPRWKAFLVCICLLTGLYASLSRGPWVGAAAMALVLVCLGPGLGRRIAISVAAGGSFLLTLMATPFGQRLIAYLPFVGTEELGSEDYRFQLFEVSMLVARQNPFFGDLRYLENPIMEQMRQGQGIIDIVNTYLQVLLPYGLVGLTLFVCTLTLPMLAVWRARSRVLYTDPEAERLGRALLAIMVGILVTIATVSTIGVIANVFWIMIGLCMSYARIAATQASTTPAIGSLRSHRRRPNRSGSVQVPASPRRR